MKKGSTKGNIFFQAIYQIVIFVTPLIISPYLSRVLGASQLGIYAFSNSIAYYFLIASNLGISKYGQRVISQTKDDSSKLRTNFWSLYSLHFFSSLFSQLVYAVLLFTVFKSQITVYSISFIYVLSATLDITWLFYGRQNFKFVTTVGTFLALLKLALIFIFVKSETNLLTYMEITYLTTFFTQFILFLVAMREVKPIKISFSDMKPHILPILYFSIAVIAVSLYNVFDKTLLGIMSTKENVAFYEFANRIVNVPIVLSGVLGTVLFPKICELNAKGKEKEAKNYSLVSLMLITFFSIGATFGILAIGKPFAIYYYGDSFAISGYCMMALSPIIYVVGIGDLFRTQYLIPQHKDKKYILSVVVAALVNIVLSVILIPIFDIYGAIIGTVAAELVGQIMQIVFARKYISPKIVISNLIPFLIIGITMYASIIFISNILADKLIYLLLEIFIGALIYFVLSSIYVFFISPSRNFYKKFFHLSR